jgi:hypothetical protein
MRSQASLELARGRNIQAAVSIGSNLLRLSLFFQAMD